MRSHIILALALLPASLAAQAAPALEMGRPVFATSGVETMPMMLIDESAMTPERFERHAFPLKLWGQEMRCLHDSLGIKDVSGVGLPPTIVVIPAVRTIRVRQLTVDSMLYAEDSTYAGQHWDSPTVATAIIRSNFIVVTEPYRANPYVLRHEALHFMLWRLKLVPLGHPRKYFGPCDVRFEPDA